jgi:hypothetical protein
LTIALKNRILKIAKYLVLLEVFDLTKVNKRTGLSYFCYAVAKGCTALASVMMIIIKNNAKGSSIEHILNPVIIKPN